MGKFLMKALSTSLPDASHGIWPHLAVTRELDLICLGRAGVDLCAVQKEVRFEDVQQFNKSVGGSPANIATAVARLGGKSAVLGLVANDGLGRSVVEFLKRNGVNTDALTASNDRSLTSLAITEVREIDCGVVIYRERAADLQLSASDIDPSFIAKSRGLLISGTALSVEPSRAACKKAIKAAHSNQTIVVLDMDYRPYGWTSRAEAAQWLVWACAQSDMVIGNTEEFALLLPEGINQENLGAAQYLSQVQALANNLLNARTQVVVLKHGAKGCELYTHDAKPLQCGIYKVKAQKPMGSGDAFAGALWWSVCRGHSWLDAIKYGAAAAAINVSRDMCAQSMPQWSELNEFVQTHNIGEFV
jgi:5-dehydro-2-deoxygluconokinase